MKLMQKVLTTMATMTVLAGAVGAAGAANAVVLRNEDTENHTVTITSPTMHKQYEFRARTLSLIVCVGVCEFTIDGVGTTRAEGDEIVAIQNGKLVTLPAPASE